MNRSCRVCLLKAEPANCKNVFSKGDTDELISDMIKAFASVELFKDDDLPQEICLKCLQKLYNAFEFKNLIIASDLYLRELLKVQKVSVKEENKKPEDCNVQEFIALNNSEVYVKQENFGDDTEHDVKSNISENSAIKDLIKKENTLNHPKTYPCTFCGQSFRSKYRLAAHRFSHTGAAPFSCEFCSKLFPTKTSLKIHRGKHSEAKPFQCKICEKFFKYPSSLTTHQKLHEGLKPYVCSTCGKNFATKGSFEAHRNTHTREMKYVCEICSKIFYAHTTLSIHLKTHKKIKVLCPICGKSYPPRTLPPHLKTHAAVKSCKCEVCGKSFSTNAVLKIHMRIHDDVKPFTCEVCGKSFRQGNVLTKHRRVHTGETPFPCTLCERKFGYKHHLKKHFEKEHAQEKGQVVTEN